MKTSILSRSSVTISILCTALLSLSSYACAYTTELPFVGVKAFNFAGGNGTEESIEISKDGTTTVTLHGTQSSGVLYQGKFQNPIPMEGGKYYYRIDGNHHIEMLNGSQQLVYECIDIRKGTTIACRSELY